MMKRVYPWFAGMLLVIFAGSCSLMQNSAIPPEKLRFTVTNINVTPETGQSWENDDPLLVNPAEQIIRLYAAGGENVAFQMIIPAGVANPLTLNIEPLKLYRPDKTVEKDIEKIHWRVYRLYEVDTGEADSVIARQEPSSSVIKRKCSDAMEELGFDSTGAVSLPEILPGEKLFLWVEMEIPRKIPRATCFGRIELKSGTEAFSKDLILHTWGFDLPDSGIDLIGIVDVPKLWQDSGIGTLRDSDRLILPPDETRIDLLADQLGEYTKLLSENGVECWPVRVYPKITGMAEDHPSIDWNGYRKLIQAVLTSSSQARKYWPVPVDIAYPQTQVYGPYDSSTYRPILSAMVREFNEKCVKPGLIGKPAAIPFIPDRYEEAINEYEKTLILMKEWFRTESGMLIVSPFIPGDLRAMGWRSFSSFDKINSTAGGNLCDERWLDPAVMEDLRGKNKRLWWRPMMSEGTLPWPKAGYPGFYSQAYVWAAWKYGTNGVVFDNVNGRADDEGASTRNGLIYSAKTFNSEKPLGSIRLKLLKRGLDDVAYLRALEKGGQKELADWMGRNLVRFAFTDASDGSLWTLRTDGLCNNDRAWMLPRLIAGFTLAERTTTAPATQRAESDRVDLLRKHYISQFRE
jgi:hypothetical protein